MKLCYLRNPGIILNIGEQPCDTLLKQVADQLKIGKHAAERLFIWPDNPESRLALHFGSGELPVC